MTHGFVLQQSWDKEASLLPEKELLDIISNLLPIGEENAIHLGPSLVEPLQVVQTLDCRQGFMKELVFKCCPLAFKAYGS